MTIKDEFCFQAALGSEGPAGAPGKDGLTPFINEAGNWQIGLSDTGVKAAGTNGAPGKDGLTPVINPAGNWQIGPNDTGIKAAGENGRDGQNGTDGTPARVNVAGTETLEPNAPAQVINRGTEQNAQLLFKIPRGARGEETTLRQPHYDTFADLLREHPAGTVQEAYVVGTLNDIYIWDPVVHNWVSVGRLGWLPDIVEEELNKKQDRLTVEQMAAVNSGMTADKRDAYDAYADEIKTVAADGKAYTDDKTGEVRDLVNALQLVKFVSALPETGESKYLYAVPQDEKTLEGENIVLLFVWDEWNGWATVGVQTTAVDLSEYAKQADLTAETSARQEADLALETATAAKYGPDNLTAGAGVKITALPKPGGIDAHTKAVWHFDGDTYMPIPQTSYFQGNLSGDTGVGMVSSQAKFGGNSLQLAGAGAYFGAVVRDWDLFAGDFTLEFWHYITGNLGVTLLGFSPSQTDFDVRNFPFRLSSGSLGSYSNNRLKINEIELNSAVEEPKNQWNHIALTFTKATSQVKLYLNGTFYGETTLSAVPSGACNLTFYEQSNLAQYFDEVRVSDVVRYDGDFTPRETAFYDDADTPTEYEISATAGGAGLPLFTPLYLDHAPEDMSWVKSNYAQLSKAVYPDAYAKLLDAFNGAGGAFNLSGGDKTLSEKLRLLLYGLTKYVEQNITFDGIGTIDVDAVTWHVGILTDKKNYGLCLANGKEVLFTQGDPVIMYSANGYTYAVWPHLTGSNPTGIGINSSDEWTLNGDCTPTVQMVTMAQAPTDILEFYRAVNGWRIIDAQDTAAVAAAEAEYTALGIAWYYILNTDEEWFKLPRNDWFFQGGGNETPGQRVDAGLPDHTHQAPYGKNDNGHYHDRGSARPHPATAEWFTTINGYGKDSTLASASNDIYGASQTVQPPAIKMALYFYLGGNIQNAANINAGALAETVNELSGAKLDKSAIVRFETPYQQMAVNQAYTFDLTNSGLLNIPQEKWRVKFLLKMTAAQGSLAVDDVVEVVAASAWLSTYGASGLIFAKSGNNAKVVTGGHNSILWYPSSASGVNFSNTQIKLCIEAVNA